MKWKKMAALGCVIVMTVSSATGCGDQGTTVEEERVTTENQSEVVTENTTVTAQVTAVEGNIITAKVGTVGPQSGEEAPEQLGGMPEAEAAGQPDGMPEGVEPGQLGGAPDGMPEGGAPGQPGEISGDEVPDGMLGGEMQGNGFQVMPGVEGAQEGAAPLGQPGDMPKGEAPSGQPGGMMGGGISFSSIGEIITFTLTDDTEITVEYLQGSGEATVEEIVLGSVLEVTLDADNNALSVIVKNLNDRGDFGGSSEVTNGTAANTIDTDGEVSGETYTSAGDDENALRVDGVAVGLSDITVTKEGGASSNTENGDFYGQNAALLVLNGAQVTISGATVSTNAVNGNGVFSYGEGTIVNISDSVIRTAQNNSGGIQTTGGGTTNATDLDVVTQGNSAAAIRSDRGGGTVNVEGGTYETNGTGSPAVYCTADITVTDAKLAANASEGVVVEGKNSVSLTDCELTGNMDNTYNGDSEENIHCIMIYQSMSGDAAVGDAYFSAEGGSITSLAGDMFYITNTDCEISLKEVAFTMANEVFLRVEGNSSSRGWGTQGANGGDVILKTNAQTFRGNILVDEISSLNLSMTNGTSYSGAINPNGEGGTVTVTLDADSSWTLTGDSYIADFDGDVSNVDANGYHLYVDGEELL